MMQSTPLGPLLALALAVISPLPIVASAHSISDEGLKGVGFSQHPGDTAALDASFLDEAARSVTLRDYVGDRPIILTLNYLRCSNLCPVMLASLAADLNALPFAIADQLTVVTVSIDPRDIAEQAVDTRAQALQQYERPGAEEGWHVLTGTHDQIDKLADSVGFSYSYDEGQDEFAHPAGIVVLTPQGVIGRYLYGLDFSPVDLRLALVEAAQGRVGSVVDQVLLTCFHYDAQVGRYTPVALNAIRLGAVLTVLLLGSLIAFLFLHEPGRTRADGGRPG
jgi:protein SCO1/2